MTTTHITQKFHTAINWNAYLYTVYKACSFLLTTLLYKYTTPEVFSQWAMINSSVFLLLLWLDCGFRKSIPRYAAYYATPDKQKRYITKLIGIQLTIIVLATGPFIYFFDSYYPVPSILLLATTGLILTEGLLSCINLIYQSYFHQKTYNTIYSSSLFIQTLISIGCIYYGPPSLIIPLVLMSRVVCNGIIILITALGMPSTPQAPTKKINSTATKKSFIKHSTIMWGNTAAKSLSERNFLVPFITATLGPQIANIFKVANDAALLTQRIIIKTIGAADTALLSHAHNDLEATQEAFTVITTKIISLCLPLLGIIAVILSYHDLSLIYKPTTQIFLLLAAVYIAETILLPAERLLEVGHHYYHLLVAYAPYIAGLAILYGIQIYRPISLPLFILALGGIRMISVLMMAYYGRCLYKVKLPVSQVGQVTKYILAATAVTIGIVQIVCRSSIMHMEWWYI